MKSRFRAVRLFLGILTATLILGGPGFAAAAKDEPMTERHFDLEIGTGFVLGIEDDTTIDDTWHIEIKGAYPMNDSIDLEFGASWAPGEDPDSSGTENNTDLYQYGAGFRWYTSSTPEDRIRFYLNVGLSVYANLKGEDSDPLGAYFGPGLRMQLGESSGMLFKLPLWVSINGQTNTLLSPTLTWFYSF